MKAAQEVYIKKIRLWILFFIVGLVLSGITAFPLTAELKVLVQYTSWLPESIAIFIKHVYEVLLLVDTQYPFLAYGTDWLAFAHIVIAIAFYGPYKDPVKNIWVIEFGMISCVLIIPLAFICGPIRQIPFYWQLIDCSFGVFGILPLYYVHKQIKKLELLIHQQQHHEVN